MKINYQEFEAVLAGMSNKSILFNLIKQEMKKRNHWKPKPRGKSFAKGNEYAKRSIDK